MLLSKSFATGRAIPFFVLGAAALLGTGACGGADAGSGEKSTNLGQAIQGGQLETGYPAVGYFPELHCTGFLVSPSFVLTANHCVVPTPPTTFSIGSSAYDLDPHDVDKVRPNPNGDYAIVHLTRPILGIAPLRLTAALPAPGTTCTAVGFGIHDTATDGTKRSCTETVESASAGEIDVVWGTGIADNGDSGGPLILPDGSVPALVSAPIANEVGPHLREVYQTLDLDWLLRQTWAYLPEAVHAAATPDGNVHVRWAGSLSTPAGWRVSVGGRAPQTVYADASTANSFVATLQGSPGEVVHVCAELGDGRETCAFDVKAENAAHSVVSYRMLLQDADATTSGTISRGYTVHDGLQTIPWANANRVAYEFCSSLGFAGGQLDGTTLTDEQTLGDVKSTIGVNCFGEWAFTEDTTLANVGSIATTHGFADVNAVDWAQGAAAASDVCQYEHGLYGMMTGEQTGTSASATKRVLCLQDYDWMDVPVDTLASYAAGFQVAPQLATWDVAARAVNGYCTAQGELPGVLTGKASYVLLTEELRVVCLHPPPPACVPTTCSAAGAVCGSASDGCGGSLSCGTCSAGNTCSANHCCPTGQEWNGSACYTPVQCKPGYYDCGNGACVRNPKLC